ncbi:LysR family transcriptional regulator (plasmid) [Shinella sp. PSBB067]|uniref:LysR family transcriptional regulator n=1 Tax=unclassified Shinella TaxID=2643062 RepID=UPI00193C48B3|nr:MULTISPECIES: LysR family transcriptional regulator [unclassified Shinella]QRI66619.1 LysR family transcriptional regulator [Shinella sp. PSBB067]
MKDNRLLEMRVFRSVIDGGGFTAAAHILGVSQSSISYTLDNLEKRLGVRLMHRSTRGFRLTEEGRKFAASCAEIIALVDQAEGAIATAKSHVVGDLRVTAPIAFGTDQIVPRIPAFLQRHAGLNVILSLDDQNANLIEENFDVAIRMGRLTDSALISKKICDLQRIVVASPRFISNFGKPKTPQDLANFNCLLWHGSREHLNRWPFQTPTGVQNIVANGNFRGSNGLTLVQLCLEGVGIMRMAEHLSLPLIRDGTLVPLLKEYQAVDNTAIHAVYLPERHLLPRIRSFIEYLSEVFRVPPWK